MNDRDFEAATPEAILASCFALCRAGRLREADALADRALGRLPEDGCLWQMRGFLRHRLRDWRGALDALETACSLVPLKPAARCALADCYARAGKAGLARDLYRELIESGGCPTALLHRVASGLGGLGEDGLALDACVELSRREPGRPEALFGAAFYLRRLGHPAAEVLPLVVRAHELAPDAPLYRITYAWLLALLGRQEEAREILGDVDMDAIGCRGCLRRVMSLFGPAGEVGRAEPRPDLGGPPPP